MGGARGMEGWGWILMGQRLEREKGCERSAAGFFCRGSYGSLLNKCCEVAVCFGRLGVLPAHMVNGPSEHIAEFWLCTPRESILGNL